MAWSQSKYNYNNNSYGDNPYYAYLKLTAEVTEIVNTSDNTSTLSVAVSLYHANISKLATSNSVTVKWVGTGGTISGDTLSTPSMSGPSSGTRTTSFGTSSITVGHDDTGKASGVVVVEWATGSLIYHGTSYTELGCKVVDMTLTDIARKATITYAPNFNSGSNPMITYDNPLGVVADGLEACISLTGTNPDVAYRDISKTGTSYTFNLTTSERNVLISATSGPSRTVKFVVRTTIGTDYYYDGEDVTFTVSSEGQPDVSLSVTPDNSNIPSTYRSNFNGLYIENKSKVSASISATPKGGATISSYSTVVDGATYSGASFTSLALSNSGAKSIVATVTDSRTISNTDTQTINVLPYSKPSIANAECYRSDSSGNPSSSSTSIWIKATRQYNTVTVSGTQKNYCQLKYRYKLASADNYGAWTVLKDRATSGDTYDALISGTFAITSPYNIQIGVSDDIGEQVLLTFDIPTDTVPLHLGAGGQNVGIGRYADTSVAERVNIGWKTIFDEGFKGMQEIVPAETPTSRSVLDFVLSCDEGCTPYYVPGSADISSLPTLSMDWLGAVGFVFKFEEGGFILIFQNYNDAKMYINMYTSSWWGWHKV